VRVKLLKGLCSATSMSRPGGRSRARWAVYLTVGSWLGILVLLCVLASGLDLPEATPGEGEYTKALDLRLVGDAEDGETRPVYRWSRAKAIEFGMTQLVERLKFFVVAATATLAFLLRWLTGSAKGGQAKPLDLTALVLVSGSACGMFVSLIWGVLAHHYLVDLPTLDAFSIYGEIRVCALYQILTFMLAGGLLVAQVIRVAMRRVRR
jgi:hypothetical protein